MIGVSFIRHHERAYFCPINAQSWIDEGYAARDAPRRPTAAGIPGYQIRQSLTPTLRILP
jgi:hypothetical protein